LVAPYRQPREEERGSGHGREEHDFYRRWAEMDATLGRMLAESERMPDWLDAAHGADVCGPVGFAQGGPFAQRGIDAVSLSAGSGANLKGFRGLQEGIGRLC
jgi:hypothetical protein